MVNKDRRFLLIMEFMDYFIKDLGYFVTNTPNIVAEIQTKQGYGKSKKADSLPSSVNFNFEITHLSRDEIITYAERVSLMEEGNEFGESGDEMKSILLKYLDDFVEDHFVYKNMNTDRQIKIHRGYRPKRRKEGSQPLSLYSASFSAVQPSREEIENQVAFFISQHLKKI